MDQTFLGVSYLHLYDADRHISHFKAITLIGLLTARLEVTWSLRFVEPCTSTPNFVFAVFERLTST